MRFAILPCVVAFSLATFTAMAADPTTPQTVAATASATPAPAAVTGDGAPNAGHSSFTEGAPAQDRTGKSMTDPTREPDLDRKPGDPNRQVNITGVVEARMVDSQIVCKNSPIVGSHLATRLCMPLYKWKQMRRDAQQMIQDGQDASHYGKVELGFGIQ